MNFELVLLVFLEASRLQLLMKCSYLLFFQYVFLLGL